MRRLVSKLSNDAHGVVYTLLACFFGSILVALVRHLSADFHVFMIVTMRNLFGLVFFLPQIAKNYHDVFDTKKIKLHFLRGLNGLIAMILWFYIITVIPLSEGVAISFFVPILTMVAAVVFLKEKPESRLWMAAFIGFIGVLVIVRPGFREFSNVYILFIFVIILRCISDLLVKILTRTDKPKTIVFYMSFTMAVMSIPFAITHWQPMDFESLMYFAATGFMSNLTHICISRSYKKTALSLVQPFGFTHIIFTAIIAYFAFGEVMDVWTIAGSLVILLGVILAMPHRKKRAVASNTVTTTIG